MPISEYINSMIDKTSWIRKMFEEGARRKKEFGDDKVFDFSIGNPVFEPPVAVREALKKLAADTAPGTHRYMPNPGYPETRTFMAETISSESGKPFAMQDIVMTCGAGGALNVVLRTLLNPDDEVLVIKPFFVDYLNYITNYRGKPVPVESNEDFSLNIEAIRAALTPRTKAMIINSPHNPTGVVYSAASLESLGKILEEHSTKTGTPITLIADEPYRYISYDVDVPWICCHYKNSIIVNSFSKDLALPGERIGYIAVSPEHVDRTALQAGLVISLRILGFVNAPAMMQRLLPLAGTAKVDTTPYRKNRDLLYNHLTGLGFSCVKPEGAFYLFLKAPIDDDVEFVKIAQELNLLLVPGSGFGAPGYCRIAYCFDTGMIERSLPVFSKLAEKFDM